eukprot:13731209-Alexandrium_andersonii.AAC.1
MDEKFLCKVAGAPRQRLAGLAGGEAAESFYPVDANGPPGGRGRRGGRASEPSCLLELSSDGCEGKLPWH